MKIRRVTSEEDLAQVRRLHHDTWVEAGFLEPLPNGELSRCPEFDTDRSTHVLVAEEAGRIVGTNSMTIDGPLGVPMDHGLKAEVDTIRAETRSLAASWRISVQADQRSSKLVVLSLIRETIRIAVGHDVTSCLFLFNRRHERVYERLIGARTYCDAGAFFADAPTWQAVMMLWSATDYAGGVQALFDSLDSRVASAEKAVPKVVD